MKEIKIVHTNRTDGKDYHLPVEDKEDIAHKLEKIKQNIYKYHQLSMLENPNISIITKMNIVDALEKEGNAEYGYNIESGGFWRDWE